MAVDLFKIKGQLMIIDISYKRNDIVNENYIKISLINNFHSPITQKPLLIYWFLGGIIN